MGWQDYLRRSQLACQCRNGIRPLGLVPRFSCAKIDAKRAKLRGTRGLRSSRVNLGAPRDLEIHEPRRNDRCFKLCVQQSAGDSTLPKVDVLLSLLGYCFLNQDVADLEATVRLENTRHFLESGELVGKEVEHTVRDDDVGPTVGHRK